MKCKHNNFESNVIVTRLKDKEEDEAITGYTADTTIRCGDCKMQFQFLGINPATSVGEDHSILVDVNKMMTEPTVSFDRTGLRTPIVPVEED